MQKQSKHGPITFEKCAHILCISKESFKRWVEEKGLNVIRNDYNELAISYEDFKVLADGEERFTRSRQEKILYLKNIGTLNSQKVETSISSLYSTYYSKIDLFAEYHRQLFNKYYNSEELSPMRAALLLFAKIINMSYMCLDCIRYGYSSSSLMLRTIDEACTLAEYFMLLKEDARCRSDLINWYRYDHSPSPQFCRQQVNQKYVERFGECVAPLRGQHDFLYYLKSKFIHHSFRDCDQLLSYKIKNSDLVINDVIYKGISVTERNKLFKFFGGEIEAEITSFLYCFVDYLAKEEQDSLKNLASSVSLG